jgi:hypothetical protein
MLKQLKKRFLILDTGELLSQSFFGCGIQKIQYSFLCFEVRKTYIVIEYMLANPPKFGYFVQNNALN